MEQAIYPGQKTLCNESDRSTIVTYSLYGTRIVVDAQPSIQMQIVKALPAASVSGPDSHCPNIGFAISMASVVDGADHYRVRETNGPEMGTEKLEAVLDWVATRAEQFVAEHAPNHTFVHAGVVAWRDRAIVIPGRSLSGKSTLVLQLVKAGATYYSDEYAVLDQAGRVHPFARIPRCRQRVNDELVNMPIAWRPLNPERALPVALVLKTSYVPGGVWSPRPLTSGEVFLHVLDNTVAIRTQTEMSMTALKNLSSSAKGFKTERPEATTLTRQILALIENESRN